MLTTPRKRMASYSNGIRVREPIHRWEPYERYGFGVELDSIPKEQPLWGMVDGHYLDVTYVEFRIERAGPQQVRLQLSTDYTLSTPVNAYARVWIDFLLADFQHYILDIVQTRASRV